MSLILCVIGAFIALQFTSGISQFIASNKQGAQLTGWLQWAAGKIGLAPAIITTKVVIIAFFLTVYFFFQVAGFWLLVAGGAWYLYKTGKYLVLWSKVKNAVETSVVKDVANKL